MKRYVCVHGHFYQPPRENPWLEAIERQESAYPYHDWNERITAECYAPNAASRILDERGRIVDIIDNYARISFNVGSTLMEWFPRHAPDVHAAVISADADSARRFGGHGSALAQVYNHLIMPLASARDRRTQVRWGIAAFRHRFGRDPEGMWLAETAVDTDTLEALAEHGIAFTVLAPHQAARVREDGAEAWRDVGAGGIDTGRAYRQHLPSGREIALFFYDGPLSRAVAFENLLHDGERFARRLLDAFPEDGREVHLVHIATDGETFGHHHRHGEMALSYALERIERDGEARLVNYGEFLELHPPTAEVEIAENTSWSCAHGVERWRSDCGCHTGGRPGWSQAWRTPLREGLDWLRDELEGCWEAAAAEIFADPWAARDAYIRVILDRSPPSLDAFFEETAGRPVRGAEKVRALQLMETQRQALLMYTSCGWFFNELSGIETVQVLRYADRCLALARATLGEDLEAAFVERLAAAHSNLEEWGDGREVWRRGVVPARVDHAKVAAHYAVSSIFEDYGESTRIDAFSVEDRDREVFSAGTARLAVGRALVRSEMTLETRELSYAVLHLGDHNLTGGVRPYRGEEEYRRLEETLRGTFDRADFADLIRQLDREFEAGTYSLASLFGDEQRRVLDRILATTRADVEAALRSLYRPRAPLMRYLVEASIQVPEELRRAADHVITAELRRALSAEDPDTDRVRALLAEAQGLEVELADPGLGFALTRTLERIAGEHAEAPDELERIERLRDAVSLVDTVPFEVNVWTVQNLFFEVLGGLWPDMERRASGGDADAARWIDAARSLAVVLEVAPPAAADASAAGGPGG